MFKIILFSVLYSTVCGSSINDISGDWLLAVTFPNIVFYTSCEYTHADLKTNNLSCTCNDTEKFLTEVNVGVGEIYSVPLIIVNRTEEVKSAMALKCKCEKSDNFTTFGVARWLRDEYLVVYWDQNLDLYNEKEPNTAFLFVKHIPTIAELQKVVQADEELNARDAGLFCNRFRPSGIPKLYPEYG